MGAEPTKYELTLHDGDPEAVPAVADSLRGVEGVQQVQLNDNKRIICLESTIPAGELCGIIFKHAAANGYKSVSIAGGDGANLDC
jgi:hypothetical protein